VQDTSHALQVSSEESSQYIAGQVASHVVALGAG